MECSLNFLKSNLEFNCRLLSPQFLIPLYFKLIFIFEDTIGHALAQKLSVIGIHVFKLKAKHLF